MHRDMIVNLLHNLGSRREVSRYLDALTAGHRAPPVVIKVGGAVIAERLPELASAIACLGVVGVCPIIIHGAGPQITAALDQVGIESKFINGQRITMSDTLRAVENTFRTVSKELADAIQAHGVHTQSLADGVFSAIHTTQARLGHVGTVTDVDVVPIVAARGLGAIPIISPLGRDTDGGLLNINADIAARSLTAAVGADKAVFLTGTGGLLDVHQRLIPTITLADDYETLLHEPWVHSGMRLKLQEIKTLLDLMPPESSVAITSPEHLASELFTYRGNGTLVRKGLRIQTHTSLETLDTNRLAVLITESFGRPLSDGYFSTRAIERVLVAGDYEAAAVLTAGGPVAYLDKFAVTREAQGLGIAGSLWKRLTEHAPALCWRSRAGNDINPWYTSRADGMQRLGDWIIFWRGITNPAIVTRAVKYAHALDPSFTPHIQITSESPVAV